MAASAAQTVTPVVQQYWLRKCDHRVSLQEGNQGRWWLLMAEKTACKLVAVGGMVSAVGIVRHDSSRQPDC